MIKFYVGRTERLRGPEPGMKNSPTCFHAGNGTRGFEKSLSTKVYNYFSGTLIKDLSESVKQLFCTRFIGIAGKV